MSVHVHEQTMIFHLQGPHTSYMMQVAGGYLVHLYWGAKLRDDRNLEGLPNVPNHDNLDQISQEYPQYGNGDFREPAYQIKLADGSRISELKYKGYRVVPGKPKLEGLPAVYAESEEDAETLVIILGDDYSGLTVELSYTVFAEHDAIARSARLINNGSGSLRLLRALSASLDMDIPNYDALYLAGAWSREAHLQRRPLGPGTTAIGSKRGMSGHQLNPFFALVSPQAGEDQGEVFGFSLVYSGNFLAEAEVDPMGKVRVLMGLNPFDFDWQLDAGDSFQTPEAVMVYSAAGLGGMSRTYHKLYRTRLARGMHRDKERPILVNNWEATYFNFNADKIEAIAKTGAELGIELFVLDDGWFGKRNDDTTSLGDWVVDKNKLPGGLRDVAERVNRLGLKFGLWFEPEMISPDSDLYRSHPDWCLHVPGRRRTLARTQSVLDMSRSDVREYLFATLSGIFSSVPIAYVKWDMNRSLTEIGSAAWSAEHQGEIAHRYMLGVYELMERLTAAHPDILFESCASGGGRFDPGMLYYMPQTWTSDDTDSVERLKIQYGTSLVYPVSAMGAHVSAVPNHQVGRFTPLSMRGNVAMSGNFGYELDLTKFSEEEREEVKKQIELYKEVRSLVQQGELYRLISPFETQEASWMFVSQDREEALAFYFKVLAEPFKPTQLLRLKGLDPDLEYEVEGIGVFGGDRLMNAGISFPALTGDYASRVFQIKAVR
ncbi:alpha-galactosidase [Gorillibacterium massiliense]|uniref:alpha-galactosidase n=1 Tax=Gorillibacterium massiliense TaxID=1280390 RepID=UPI0004B396B0|nr:alpha-galactosidase [Gorillibacterium massiliense]